LRRHFRRETELCRFGFAAEGLIDNYFDLYTSTAYPMNIYSKHFRGKLGFRTSMFAARAETLEESYRYFEKIRTAPDSITRSKWL
jgi:hypothetical protein